MALCELAALWTFSRLLGNLLSKIVSFEVLKRDHHVHTPALLHFFS